MKRINLILSTLFIIVMSSIATNVKAQDVVTLPGSPTSINVNAAISVEIIHAQKNEMKIEAAEKDLECFSYKMKRGHLILDRKKCSLVQRKQGGIKVYLYVTDIKSIRALNVSGASKIYVRNRLNNDRLDIDLSGASKMVISGSVDRLMLDISGASKLTTDGHFERIDLDLSGASKLSITGNFDDLKADISGASKFTHIGKANSMNIEMSGASSFNGRKSFIKRAFVDVSGVSSATLHAQEIRSDKSGLSTIRVLPYN